MCWPPVIVSPCRSTFAPVSAKLGICRSPGRFLTPLIGGPRRGEDAAILGDHAAVRHYDPKLAVRAGRDLHALNELGHGVRQAQQLVLLVSTFQKIDPALGRIGVADLTLQVDVRDSDPGFGHIAGFIREKYRD
jgi:hypothetical protein